MKTKTYRLVVGGAIIGVAVHLAVNRLWLYQSARIQSAAIENVGLKNVSIRSSRPEGVSRHTAIDSRHVGEASEQTGAVDANKIVQELKDMALVDPSAAISKAEALQDPLLRKMAIEAIIKIWAKTDLEACFGWGMNFENYDDRAHAILECMQSIDPNHLGIAYDLVNQMPKGQLRDIAFTYAAMKTSPDNYGIVAANIKNIKDLGLVHSIAKSMVEKMAQSQEGEMQSVFEGLDHGVFREMVGSLIVGEIAKSDPEGAFRWLLHNKSALSWNNALHKVVEGCLNENDPEMAVRLANSFPEGDAQSNMLSDIAQTWSKKNPFESGRWVIGKIEDSGYQNNKAMADAIFENWVQIDSIKAFEAISSISDLSARDDAKLVAISALSHYDPSGAAKEIMSLNEFNDPNLIRAMRMVADEWLSDDPTAASAWIGQMTPGNRKDTALECLVLNVLEREGDIQLAQNWSDHIQDGKIKEKLRNRIREAQKTK